MPKRCVGLRYCITLNDNAARSVAFHHAMRHKPVAAAKQHDVATAWILTRRVFDNEDIPRPNGREHTPADCAQVQPTSGA